MNVIFNKMDGHLVVSHNDILGYRLIVSSFSPPFVPSGFHFNPPCLEILLKNNKAIYISGNHGGNLEPYRKIEDSLRKAKVYQRQLSKMDILMFFILAIPIWTMMTVNFFLEISPIGGIALGYFVLIDILHIVLTHKARICIDIDALPIDDAITVEV